MGNTVASEGEDMADSPRTAKGELSTSKKPKSIRKKLINKAILQSTKDVIAEKKQYSNEVQQDSQGLNKRKNYYKNLGIGQKAGMEKDRLSGAPKKISESPPQDRELKSFTSMAITKGRLITSGASESVLLEDEKHGDLDLITRNSEFVEKNEANNQDLASNANDGHKIENRDNSGTPHDSLGETKADENEILEEDKIEMNPDDTERVESTYLNKEVEGFKLNFITQVQNKTVEQMRRKFLSKLTQEKIWLTPSEKPKTHQTWIIFDWDDTILCTTFLNPAGTCNFDLPLNVKLQLKKLEKASFELLSQCVKYGDVYIITNAAEGWVEFSSKKYMPKLTKILEKITVISARACCEDEYPDEVHQWKMKAFLKTQEKLEKGAITNLVALGDSQFEMDAVKHLGTQFPRALIKTVKFREQPTPDELVKQINLVMMKLDQIWTSAKNLTIRLERKESS